MHTFKRTLDRIVLGGSLLAASACQPTAETTKARAHEREEAEHRQTDRPDLAEAQEAALTRDPITGTVPRERLLVAQAQMAHLLKARDAARLRGQVAGGSLSAATWTEKGPSNIGGRVLTLLPDPSDATGNKLWAGTADGGLWKSNNAAGATPTWSKVSDTFANLAVSTLAYDPNSAGFNTMYFGTGEGFGNVDAVRGLGIWKSTDHGVSWTQLGSTNNSTFYFVNKLVVDGAGKIYAATGTGLQRSTDGGATWATVFGSSNKVGDVDINPVSGAIYTTIGPGTSGGGIYRSTDGGATFVNLNTLPGNGLPPTATTTRVEVDLAPSSPSQMYALFCSSGSGTPAITSSTIYGIYRSADGGSTWQALPKPTDTDPGIGADFTRRQAWYDLAVTVSPTDPATVFIGGVDIFKTSNATTATAGSVAWQQVTHWYGGFGFQDVHADQHAIEFISGSRAFFGNDGGVAITSNATAGIPTLTPINTNFNVTQFYSVAMHPTDPGYFLAGAQDNGTQQFTTATGSVTEDVNGGDGAFCFVDQADPTKQFATYVFSNISRSTNSGTSFNSLLASNTGSFINPMVFDSQSKALYFGFGALTLGRILNATTVSASGLAPTTITLPAGSGTVTHVATSPNVSNRVYVGTNQGRVIQIDNASSGAPTVATIFTGAANTSVTCVGVERFRTGAANPDQHLLVTVANYGQTHVWQTINGGTAWANIGGNLPDMPVRWVLPDPTGSQRALLATELGVWTTDNLYAATVSWQPANTSMANVRVDMLQYRPVDKMIAAATHGRGLFTSNILAVNPLPVELSIFSATAEGPATVRLAWTTAAEKNSARFEMERATDGQHFALAGTVAAAGSSSTARRYAFADGHLPADAPRLYYRLRQVDTDGAANYSPVRTVVLPARVAGLSLFPNPARATTTLAGASPFAAVQLVDLRGRVVARASADVAGTAVLLLPAGLAGGAYMVRAGATAGRLLVE